MACRRLLPSLKGEACRQHLFSIQSTHVDQMSPTEMRQSLDGGHVCVWKLPGRAVRCVYHITDRVDVVVWWEEGRRHHALLEDHEDTFPYRTIRTIIMDELRLIRNIKDVVHPHLSNSYEFRKVLIARKCFMIGHQVYWFSAASWRGIRRQAA